MSIEIESHDNLKYQRWLAESLISSLGYEGAVAACQRMSWYGALGCLLNDKGADFIMSASGRTISAEAP